MKFDLYAELAAQTTLPADEMLPTSLASWFVDACTAEAAQRPDQRSKVRHQYLERASSGALLLPPYPTLEPQFESLPDDSWLAFEVAFKLETPWYAKDDRPFHVLDNPVRKDRVFGVPYLAATSWKGLLRWACRMQAGLMGYLEQYNGKLDEWQDPPWIIHLFGNEKGEADDFQRGSLAFYPTWFAKIGSEVINPHRRQTRAGTRPIYYEVVPASTRGVLHLLYAPVPGAVDRDKVRPAETIEKLLDAAEPLLTTYGISAKRTAGWGTALVEQWKAYRNGEQPIQEAALPDFRMRLATWLSPSEERDG